MPVDCRTAGTEQEGTVWCPRDEPDRLGKEIPSADVCTRESRRMMDIRGPSCGSPPMIGDQDHRANVCTARIGWTRSERGGRRWARNPIMKRATEAGRLVVESPCRKLFVFGAISGARILAVKTEQSVQCRRLH